MNKIHSSNPRLPAHARGFTLIITISLLVLLTMIAIGLLSLSSLSLRTSQQGNAQGLARANARLALQLAIGDLQRYVGPDQRITGTADLINSSNHKQWLGVWSTTQASGTADLPVTRWTTTRGDSAILDDRSSPAITQKTFFQKWLISGLGTPEAPGSDLTKIVGTGSTNQAIDHVSVPLVKTTTPSGQGAYAYWVSDQSLKADASSGADSSNLTDNNRLIQPLRSGVGVLAGLEKFSQITDEEMNKFITRGQGELTSVGNRYAWNQWRHSTTVGAFSVLSDTIRGGLKKDLSVFLLKGNVPASGSLYPALTDNTPILNSILRSTQGPRFGSLRAWSALGDRSETAAVKPTAATNLAAMDKFKNAPNFNQFQSQPIHPVITSVQLYTRFSYIRGYLAVHLFPTILLWNPYNVKLAAAEYTIDFNHSIQDSMDVERLTAGAGGAAGSKIVGAAYDTRAGKENRMRLTIEATAFAPGEALVFSPKPNGSAISGRATPLVQRSASGQNVMSAQISPRQLTNFYITLNQLPGITAADLPIRADHNKGAYYWIDMMDWWEANPDNGLKVSLHLGSSNNYTSMMNLPLLQLIDTDNWKRGYEGRFNNGRWKVGGQELVYNLRLRALGTH
jgi:Tfp pilus assembly protein PilV